MTTTPSYFIRILKYFTAVVYRLIEPRSSNEDTRRREYILNIVLLGTVLLSGIALVTETITYFLLHGVSFDIRIILLFVITGGFFGLFLLSRFKHYRLSAYILIGLYCYAAIESQLISGSDNPQGLLLYALVIVMSGILISSLFARWMTFAISVIILVIGYLQIHHILTFTENFRSKGITDVGIIVLVATLLIIGLVSHLYTRELEDALQRAEISEHILKEERDMLEVTVEKRTQELQRAQYDKIVQLYRFAEFGRLASGILHDIVNPLTTVSLNLEQLTIQERSDNVKRAVTGIAKIEHVIEAARKQMQHQSTPTLFSVQKEISQAIEMVGHKAQANEVMITFDQGRPLELFGSHIKFHQAITNILSNALDAYDNKPITKKQRLVEIKVSQTKKDIIITIQDWGVGIPADHIDTIFEPFFTTKSPDKGTGLGLAITHDTIEKDFAGTITVQSVPDKFTVFTITLPKPRHE